jgi:hypothetical protein
MLVIEALKLSAMVIEGDLDINSEDIDLWLKCYNLVEQELATDYFPILEVETFFHVKDKIYYKDFSRKPYMLKGIQDFHGDSVSFRLTPEYINLIKNYDGGTFFVKYYYIPDAKELYSACTYGADYIHIVKYGVAAEYCLATANYELAKIYSDKYKERIKLKDRRKRNENY